MGLFKSKTKPNSKSTSTSRQSQHHISSARVHSHPMHPSESTETLTPVSTGTVGATNHPCALIRNISTSNLSTTSTLYDGPAPSNPLSSNNPYQSSTDFPANFPARILSDSQFILGNARPIPTAHQANRQPDPYFNPHAPSQHRSPSSPRTHSAQRIKSSTKSQCWPHDPWRGGFGPPSRAVREEDSYWYVPPGGGARANPALQAGGSSAKKSGSGGSARVKVGGRDVGDWLRVNGLRR